MNHHQRAIAMVQKSMAKPKGKTMSDLPELTLLEAHNAVLEKIMQIEGLEVRGAGITIGACPVADIGFDLNGSEYKLTLRKWVTGPETSRENGKG